MVKHSNPTSDLSFYHFLPHSLCSRHSGFFPFIWTVHSPQASILMLPSQRGPFLSLYSKLTSFPLFSYQHFLSTYCFYFFFFFFFVYLFIVHLSLPKCKIHKSKSFSVLLTVASPTLAQCLVWSACYSGGDQEIRIQTVRKYTVKKTFRSCKITWVFRFKVFSLLRKILQIEQILEKVANKE